MKNQECIEYKDVILGPIEWGKIQTTIYVDDYATDVRVEVVIHYINTSADKYPLICDKFAIFFTNLSCGKLYHLCVSNFHATSEDEIVAIVGNYAKFFLSCRRGFIKELQQYRNFV